MNVPTRIRMADIIEACAAHYAVSPIAIRARRRDHVVMQARHLATWFGGALTEQSNAEIGKAFGDRDPTTIIVTRRKIEAKRLDPAFRDMMDGIEAVILAAARLRELKIIAAPLDIDPHEVAQRIVKGGERAAGMASIAEIMAMGEALAAIQEEQEADRQSAIGSSDELPTAEARLPVPLCALVAELVEVDAELRRRGAMESVRRRYENAIAALPGFEGEPAIDAFLRAYAELQRALFSPGERAARLRYERALTILSQQFSTETING